MPNVVECKWCGYGRRQANPVISVA